MVPTDLGEIVHRLGVKNVPAQKCRGHSQMAADQKVYRVPARGIEAQSLENAFHRLQAAFHVALDGHAFPDVVKQQRKIQQFGMFHGGENIAEPAIQVAAALRQAGANFRW